MAHPRHPFALALFVAAPFTFWSGASASVTYAYDDTAIAAAVEDELSGDPLVALDNVSVKMQRGVVTLTGAARNLIARERAADIARTVEGVVVVVNEITVQPLVHRSAEDVETAIRDALLANPMTESFQVTVDVEPNGVVRLSGNVDSWGERQLAAYVAKSVAGITELHNDLNVNFVASRPDTELTVEIQGLIEWDAHIGDSDISVSVRGGIAQLSGTVGSAAEKDRAVTMAWSVGTRYVDAEGLKVVPNV
jgi:Predicted periplasmic or secreted lipoprotein